MSWLGTWVDSEAFPRGIAGERLAWQGHVFQRGLAEFGVLEAYAGQWAHVQGSGETSR